MANNITTGGTFLDNTFISVDAGYGYSTIYQNLYVNANSAHTVYFGNRSSSSIKCEGTPSFAYNSSGLNTNSDGRRYQVVGSSTSFTYTLPAPASAAGMVIFLRSANGTVTVSGTNKYQKTSTSATSSDISVSKKSVICFCDGTCWVIMEGNY